MEEKKKKPRKAWKILLGTVAALCAILVLYICIFNITSRTPEDCAEKFAEAVYENDVEMISKLSITETDTPRKYIKEFEEYENLTISFDGVEYQGSEDLLMGVMGLNKSRLKDMPQGQAWLKLALSYTDAETGETVESFKGYTLYRISNKWYFDFD